MPECLAMPENPLVAVIDDETGSRESMAIAIEKAGLGVRTFDDARKALEYLQETPSVRVAICDLRMPDMDGLAFIHLWCQAFFDRCCHLWCQAFFDRCHLWCQAFYRFSESRRPEVSGEGDNETSGRFDGAHQARKR